MPEICSTQQGTNNTALSNRQTHRRGPISNLLSTFGTRKVTVPSPPPVLFKGGCCSKGGGGNLEKITASRRSVCDVSGFKSPGVRAKTPASPQAHPPAQDSTAGADSRHADTHDRHEANALHIQHGDGYKLQYAMTSNDGAVACLGAVGSKCDSAVVPSGKARRVSELLSEC